MATSNKRLSEENFGTDSPSPSLSKGTITTFGHLANDKVIPSRGTSVNVKTGYPVTK